MVATTLTEVSAR